MNLEERYFLVSLSYLLTFPVCIVWMKTAVTLSWTQQLSPTVLNLKHPQSKANKVINHFWQYWFLIQMPLEITSHHACYSDLKRSFWADSLKIYIKQLGKRSRCSSLWLAVPYGLHYLLDHISHFALTNLSLFIFCVCTRYRSENGVSPSATGLDS